MASTPTSLPLLWHGSLLEASGYADEARAYLLALEEAGYRPVAHEVRWSDLDAGATPAQLAAVERAKARARPRGPYAVAHHFVPRTGQPLHDDGPDVARTMFETDRIPQSFLRRLLEVDEVWVPCAFNVDTFTFGGVPRERIHVLPETLDFELFAPGVEPLPVAGRRGFTFLASFDFTDRKGWDVLLRAWSRAFGPGDDVCLLLKCISLHGMGGREIEERILRELGEARTAPIVVNTDLLPVADLPRLYAAADAFVLPSRGEGWGRPYMEAMAMGLPTIGSRFSGNLDFMHDGNAWLVDGRLVDVPERAQRHTSLYAGHRWFDPDVDSLATAMREVAGGGADVERRASGARAELIERFGPAPVAARIAELTHGAIARWQERRSRPVAAVWRGPFGGGTSLAVVNDGCVGALEAAGAAVALLPAGDERVDDDAVGVAQQWPPSFDAPSGGPFVLYQPWEFGRVPAAWVDRARRTVDEIWTPSEAARASFVASGLSPELVHVVPNGVDLAEFTPDGPALPLPARAGTVFLFVGAPLHRKGLDILLDAYGRAFSAADDVALVLKLSGLSGVYRGSDGTDAIAAFHARASAPALHVLDDDLCRNEIPALYRAVDVVVQPYRGEGFCLPALEALASGRPPVVTAGGPTDDFVDHDCGWLVPSRRVSIPADAFPEELALEGEGHLLEPDADALVEILREAADPDARAVRAGRARARAESYSWEAIGGHLARRLEGLRGTTPIRRVPPAVVPGSRRLLLAALPDWSRDETWAEPLTAYASAFTPGEETTLVLPATDSPEVLARIRDAAGRFGDALPDVALAKPGPLGAAALALAADAVIDAGGSVPKHARRVVAPEPDALRALLEAAA